MSVKILRNSGSKGFGSLSSLGVLTGTDAALEPDTIGAGTALTGVSLVVVGNVSESDILTAIATIRAGLSDLIKTPAA